jgi:hypothetical protein
MKYWIDFLTIIPLKYDNVHRPHLAFLPVSQRTRGNRDRGLESPRDGEVAGEGRLGESGPQ